VITLPEVKVEVEHLLATSGGDPESWHGNEDDLMVEVLRAVAGGAPEAAEMAAEVLRIQDSEHARWYA